jgi:hypothetical protein
VKKKIRFLADVAFNSRGDVVTILDENDDFVFYNDPEGNYAQIEKSGDGEEFEYVSGKSAVKTMPILVECPGCDAWLEVEVEKGKVYVNGDVIKHCPSCDSDIYVKFTMEYETG